MIMNSICILPLQQNLILLLLLLGVNGCSSFNAKTNLPTQTTSIVKVGSSDIAIAVAGENLPTIVFEGC